MKYLSLALTLSIFIGFGNRVALGDEGTPSKQDVLLTLGDVMGLKSPYVDSYRISKWTKDIRVAIASSGDANISLIKEIGDIFDQVVHLTGVNATYSTSNSDFVIIFLKDPKNEIDRYKGLLKAGFTTESEFDHYVDTLKKGSGECSGIYASNAQSDANFYFVIVSTAKDDSRKMTPENCLARSILSGVGLGVGNTSSISAFNPTLKLGSITPIDKVMLRAFYKSDVQSGMPAKTAASAMQKYLDSSGVQ